MKTKRTNKKKKIKMFQHLLRHLDVSGKPESFEDLQIPFAVREDVQDGLVAATDARDGLVVTQLVCLLHRLPW